MRDIGLIGDRILKCVGELVFMPNTPAYFFEFNRLILKPGYLFPFLSKISCRVNTDKNPYH